MKAHELAQALHRAGHPDAEVNFDVDGSFATVDHIVETDHEPESTVTVVLKRSALQAGSYA